MNNEKTGLGLALQQAEYQRAEKKKSIERIRIFLGEIKYPFRIISKQKKICKVIFEMKRRKWQWIVVIDGKVFSVEDFIMEIMGNQKLLERTKKILFAPKTKNGIQYYILDDTGDVVSA